MKHPALSAMGFLDQWEARGIISPTGDPRLALAECDHSPPISVAATSSVTRRLATAGAIYDRSKGTWD